MARKKSTSAAAKEEEKAAVVDTEDEDDVEDDDEEVAYLQVDTGDIVKLKQILDETVVAALVDTDGEDSLALSEDYKLDNIKLSLMFLGCSFAMFAQFAPLPFPDSRFILGGCCAVYFLISGILQLITTFLDKDCIMITKPVSLDILKKHKLDASKNKDITELGLRVRTQLPKFSEFYTVILEFQDKENTPMTKKTWSVGQFFDVEGMFDEYGLVEEVEKVFKRFAQGDFDTEDENKTESVKKTKTKKAKSN